MTCILVQYAVLTRCSSTVQNSRDAAGPASSDVSGRCHLEPFVRTHRALAPLALLPLFVSLDHAQKVPPHVRSLALARLEMARKAGRPAPAAPLTCTPRLPPSLHNAIRHHSKRQLYLALAASPRPPPPAATERRRRRPRVDRCDRRAALVCGAQPSLFPRTRGGSAIVGNALSKQSVLRRGIRWPAAAAPIHLLRVQRVRVVRTRCRAHGATESERPASAERKERQSFRRPPHLRSCRCAYWTCGASARTRGVQHTHIHTYTPAAHCPGMEQQAAQTWPRRVPPGPSLATAATSAHRERGQRYGRAARHGDWDESPAGGIRPVDRSMEGGGATLAKEASHATFPRLTS